jgi:hypothetical protein
VPSSIDLRRSRSRTHPFQELVHFYMPRQENCTIQGSALEKLFYTDSRSFAFLYCHHLATSLYDISREADDTMSMSYFSGIVDNNGGCISCLHNTLWSPYDELVLWHICTKSFAESDRILWSTSSIISDWNDSLMMFSFWTRIRVDVLIVFVIWQLIGSLVLTMSNTSAVNLELSAKHTQYIPTHDPLFCMDTSPVTIGWK